jgi:RNA polymerase-binding protein DksA
MAKTTARERIGGKPKQDEFKPKAKKAKIEKPKTKRVEVQKPKHESVVRYSDQELSEFKELINQKLEIARHELSGFQKQLNGTDEIGDHSDSKPKGLDDGTSTAEREYLSMMAGRQIQLIGHLENALKRIDNGTYGICRKTGKLIGWARLRAVPHATLSIEAKKEHN